VRGETESAGVCDTLTVAQYRVRRDRQASEGFKRGWRFPERQEPGDIGEHRRASRDRGLQQRQAGKVQYYDSGACDFAAFLEAHIDSRDPLDALGIAFCDHQGGEFPLQGYRFSWRNVPGV